MNGRKSWSHCKEPMSPLQLNEDRRGSHTLSCSTEERTGKFWLHICASDESCRSHSSHRIVNTIRGGDPRVILILWTSNITQARLCGLSPSPRTRRLRSCGRSKMRSLKNKMLSWLSWGVYVR